MGQKASTGGRKVEYLLETSRSYTFPSCTAYGYDGGKSNCFAANAQPHPCSAKLVSLVVQFVVNLVIYLKCNIRVHPLAMYNWCFYSISLLRFECCLKHYTDVSVI